VKRERPSLARALPGRLPTPGLGRRRLPPAPASDAGPLPDAPNKELRSYATPSFWLESLQLKGLHIGQAHVDLLFQRKRRRTQVEVLDVGGRLKVTFPNRWPL